MLLQQYSQYCLSSIDIKHIFQVTLTSVLQIQLYLQSLTNMIKNKTEEFKQRYAKSMCSTQLKLRDKSPDFSRTKMSNTKCTFSDMKTLEKSNRMAKVQSSSFLKTNKQFFNKTNFVHRNLEQQCGNQTSLCRMALNSKSRALKIEKNNKPFIQKVSETQTTQKSIFLEKQQIKIRQLVKPQNFFQNLTPRNLFFCCKCLTYIFAVQKNLHYPKCENQISIENFQTKKQMHAQGWKKLKRIYQLSEYTDFKFTQISEMYENLKHNQLSSLFLIDINGKVQFLEFEMIIQAFVYTYEKLLKGSVYNESSIFSNKLFACFQSAKPKKQQSKWIS